MHYFLNTHFYFNINKNFITTTRLKLAEISEQSKTLRQWLDNYAVQVENTYFNQYIYSCLILDNLCKQARERTIGAVSTTM